MSLIKETIQALVVIVLIHFPASASVESVSSIQFDAQTNSVQFISEINESSEARLMQMYKVHKFSNLVVTSPGGDFDVGLRLGEFVKEQGITVIVYKYCNSSCSIVFFSADVDQRYMTPNSILGLHNVSVKINAAAGNGDDTFVTVRQLSTYTENMAAKVGFLFSLYAANGIPPDVLMEVSKIRGDNAIVLTDKQLYQYGSIKNLAGTD